MKYQQWRAQTHEHKMQNQASMPSTRSLFETIKCFHQATEVLRMVRINKPRGLTHVNLLLKNTMQKRIRNIQLTKGPTSCDSKGQK